MRRWVRLALFGLVAYLFFLVATFPAAHAYRLLREESGAGVAMAGIDGSIWSGTARTVQLGGKVRLQNVHWEVHFLPLLLGRLELELSSRDRDLQLNTRAGKTLGGTLYVEGLHGRLPIARVQALTPYPVPRLRGELIFDGLDAALADGRIVKGAGRVRWNGAAAVVGSTLQLGGFTLDLKTDKQQIIGKLRDNDGPLQVEGLLTLEPDGTYHLGGRVTPRDSSSDVAQNLRILGVPNKAGGYELNYSGKLAIPVD